LTGKRERLVILNRTNVKAQLITIAVTLFASACRTVTPPEESIPYPLPPAPLSQFLKSPSEGIYSLPKSVPSGYGPDLRVIVVSAGKVRLSCLDHGKIGTNDWNFVEVKTTLPAEDAFKEVSTGATEEEVERRFGKPTWEQDRNATINWKKMPANTRVVSYQWCAVSPKSEFVFLRMTAIYRRKDGVWTVSDCQWSKMLRACSSRWIEVTLAGFG
jgi:hypothetical protein